MNEMETELAKAAGKVTIDIAEDLMRPTSKSIGDNLGMLVDGVMGWLGYWGQKQKIKQSFYLDEYKKQIAQKIAEIPEKNLVEPPLRIVGPAIEASKFFIEENSCREMFAQLISSACNSELSNSIHPSFPEIIKQLSPLDARFLLVFKKKTTFPMAELTEQHIDKSITPYPTLLFDFMDAQPNFTYPEQIELSKTIDNLVRFGLLIRNDKIIQLHYDYNKFKQHWLYKEVEKNIHSDSKLIIHSYRLELTLLGKDFLKSCVPDEN